MGDTLKNETLEKHTESQDDFEINWSFFMEENNFEDIVADPEFQKRVERIVEFSARAFGHQNISFFCNHICVRAFLYSYAEEMRAQEEVMNTVGMMPREDILDIKQIFTVPRTNDDFVKSFIFTLGWFQELVRRYESNGFTGARDKFGDIMQPCVDENRKIYFSFPQPQLSSSGGYAATLEINLVNSNMKIILKDYLLIEESRRQKKVVYLSEYLEANNPFLDHVGLNFLFPMGYRGFVFPLFNVHCITIRNTKGTHKEEKYSSIRKQDILEGTTNKVLQVLLPE